MRTYVPKRGDIVWLTFSPQAGHEQVGRRPALVISQEAYSRRVGLFLACPITRQQKGYPFEVSLPATNSVAGVVLSDQVKSLDWRERKAEYADKVDAGTLAEVVGKLEALIAAEPKH